MTALVWLRHDFRMHDNPALFQAAELDDGVIAIYIHCEAYVAAHSIAPCQLEFIQRHLKVLRNVLAARGISLVVLKVLDAAQIAPALLGLAQAHNVSHCFFNAEYPLDELQRDRQVNLLLSSQGIVVKRCHDRVILPPGSVRNGQGDPYKVFTAFKKKWLQQASCLTLQPYGLPKIQAHRVSLTVPEGAIGQLYANYQLRDLSHLWPAGEAEATLRLTLFIENGLDSYHLQRDYPAVAGTSSLSPYLAVGSISVRQAIHSVLMHTQGEWQGSNTGANTWLSELIWREFYQHLVVDFPQVCKFKPMQAHTEYFPWQHNRLLFDAWCEGKTGIPIIDAAMRQLQATGWMHNRLRMVVAMFLTKNLQIDWRWGEAYFMSMLIDGDFTANNGGWQWSASTGTDAAPYFRIFNPVSQSQRFDPEGDFIRTWVPELASLSAKQIHSPPLGFGYIPPIVDLGSSRKETIALFSALKGH